MAGKDYYSILGVSKTATDKEIKQAYRKLARQFHPDVNPGNKEAEEKFKGINEAYEVISDPEKRKKFDQWGENWKYADQFAKAGYTPGSPGAPGGPSGPFGPGGPETGETYTRYYTSGEEGAEAPAGDIFESLFRGARGGRRRARPRKGEDVEFQVEVTLEEAYSGAMRMVQLEGEDVCPVCKGAGALQNAPCYSCGGAGRVIRPRRLEVKIPAGVKNGSRVRIAGGGGPGLMGGEKGDLYLLISIRPHPLFELKGDDLYTDADVPLDVAVLGGEVEVATLKGKVALTIPPETQNGKVFRLGGLGMPHLGDGVRGDLYARARVVLPQGLTEKEKDLFRQMRKLRGK